MGITINQLFDIKIKTGVILSDILARSINSKDKATMESFIANYIREKILAGKIFKKFTDTDFNSVSVCELVAINSLPQTEDNIFVGFDV